MGVWNSALYYVSSNTEFPAHGNERQQGEFSALHERQKIDAVADAAALHQQDGAGAAQIGACRQRDAFFFRRERDGVHIAVGNAQVDQNDMSGVGYVGELRDIVRPQHLVADISQIAFKSMRSYPNCTAIVMVF